MVIHFLSYNNNNNTDNNNCICFFSVISKEYKLCSEVLVTTLSYLYNCFKVYKYNVEIT